MEAAREELSSSSESTGHQSDSEPTPERASPPHDYEYLPLPPPRDEERWIRLLDILPSKRRKDPIQVRLRAVRLERDLKYAALSYVWGNPNDNSTITVVDKDDPLKAGSVQIRRSLDDVLRILRRPRREKTIWVDALCINQNDNKERGKQVEMMGLIYWMARRVLIWLGPDENGNAQLTLDAMHRRSAAYFKPGHPDKTKPLTQDQVDALDAEAWNGIAELYRKEWFSRVWVQQEVGLSRNAAFLWGRARCCHHDVLGFDMWLEPAGQLAVKRFNIQVELVRGARNSWLNYGRSTRPSWSDDRDRFMRERPFLVTLAEAASCHATDARDHIYAFLGHPSSKRKHAYQPDQKINYLEFFNADVEPFTTADYDKPLDEVFLETAVKLLDQHRDLRMLGAVRHTDDSLKRDYPSWVPRWDDIGDMWPLGVYPFEFKHAVELDDAGPNAHTETISLDQDGLRLSVFGLPYREIDHLFDLEGQEDKWQPRSRGRRLFRTKSGDPHSTPAVGSTAGATVHLIEAAEGLAPTAAIPGDIIAIIIGSFVPCILRHVKDDDYKFVGTCDMFGIMDGRMRRIVRREAARLQQFHLT